MKKIEGKIALVFDNIGLGMKIAVEGKGSNSFETESDFDFTNLSTTTSYLSGKTPIEYEKEIPLTIQIHTSKNNISSLNPEYGFLDTQTYTNLGYEKVYAVTCLFSQKTVDQLSN